MIKEITAAIITMYGIVINPRSKEPVPICVNSGRKPPIGWELFGSISKYKEQIP